MIDLKINNLNIPFVISLLNEINFVDRVGEHLKHTSI